MGPLYGRVVPLYFVMKSRYQQKEEKEENEEEKGGYIVRERNYGSCSRSFYVGDHVTENDVKAAYKDGALHLSFPKEAPKEVPETKYIAIE